MRPTCLFATAVAVCLSPFVFAMPALANGPSPQTEAAIKAENARWAEAFRQGDYDAIGHLYTKNGELMPPGEGRVTGGAAITEYFAKAYAGSQPGSVSFNNVEFYGNDEAVTEVSDADVRDHRGNLKIHAKQILIFLKNGGVWKLHRDMWSSYAP
jgi:ketosteroid isomerase-like protein